MKILANLLWLIFGGIILSIMWILSGLICCITIIGIPLGIQCFKLSAFILCPFGKEICYGEGLGNFFLNILWIFLLGWELSISSIIIGIAWCITILGIPIGVQCFKFAKLAFMPFGATIIET